MPDYDNDLTGALFKAEKKSEKSPDYRGSCEISGVQFWVSAWIKTSKGGDKYMSLSFQAKDDARGRQHKGGTTREERDDSIPF